MNTTLHILFFSISILWLYIVSTLMIADVWDETNIIVVIQSKPFSGFSLYQSIKYVWINYLSLYRPLPSSVLLIINHIIGIDFVLLRYLNALLVIFSIYLLSKSLFKNFSIKPYQVFFFYTLSLYSSSALITAGWFANIFDAMCLFFISIGILLLSEKKYIFSAISIGLSFYCKETAILIIPFLGFILYNKKVNLKKLIAPVIIIALLGGLYWYLRQRVIPIGSQGDIHAFALDTFFPSFFTFLKSFWWQHTKYSSNSLSAWLGLMVLVLSIATIKNHVDKLFAILIIIFSALIYWGMFSYQEEVIVSSENFIGRLYLIPSIIVLYIISTKSNKYIFLFLTVFILSGTVHTYIAHLYFQKVYFNIYKLAKKQIKPIFIYYPEKPLSDQFRNIYIGNYLHSKMHIDINKAMLIRKD